jgi:hypothetical protein
VNGRGFVLEQRTDHLDAALAGGKREERWSAES